MPEIFKSVVLRDGLALPYEISSEGVVYRVEGEDRIGKYWPRAAMKPTLLPSGYLDVIMRLDGEKYHSMVHTLVAFAFLPPPPGEYGQGKITINHKTAIKTDNRAENLEWMTCQDNSSHASSLGLMPFGEDHPNSVLTENSVIEIRQKWSAGSSFRGLAVEYGCSKFAISQACKRKTWKHI